MAQLIVRKLDPRIPQALKLRAAREGRSAEAEHREILRRALLDEPRRPLKEMLQAIPEVGEDADFERAQDIGREVEL